MNQILECKGGNSGSKCTNVADKGKKQILKPFKIQFVICSAILFISLSFYLYHMYDLNKKENTSKSLIESFNVATLYSGENKYQAIKTSIDENTNNHENIFVIGLLEIDSIDLAYPILSEATNDYLKISPCKFYGPMPNEVGNLCIAGHNYKNYKFFSRLNDIKIGDSVKIQDLNGNKLDYTVYDKYDIAASELNCTNQNTNGKKEVTLITCNSINNTRRIVVKAKETG